VVVLNSMQNFQIPLLWATVIVIAAMTLSGYGLLTLAERAARGRIGECDG
jgi:NitT/TauT family transport system permease protein